jgi:hypothetical protein
VNWERRGTVIDSNSRDRTILNHPPRANSSAWLQRTLLNRDRIVILNLAFGVQGQWRPAKNSECLHTSYPDEDNENEKAAFDLIPSRSELIDKSK